MINQVHGDAISCATPQFRTVAAEAFGPVKMPGPFSVNDPMSRLNPRQQEAVNYVGGPLLVLAGAGSGKTSVITRKIAHLVQNCGIRAQHIVAMTFTNKAAREMKERVGTYSRAARRAA